MGRCLNSFSLGLLFFAFSGVCWGDALYNKASEEDSLVFTVMGFGESMFEDILFENVDGDLQELVFDPYGRSRAYRVPKGERVIEFLKEVAYANGKVRRQSIARFDTSDISRRGLLVFYPNYARDGDSLYNIIGVDESDDRFGPGAFRFLNLTGTGLLTQIESQEQLLSTGFSDVFQFDYENRKPISFQFAAKVKDQWKLVYATKRQSDMRRGTLFILKPPAKIDSLKIGVHALIETLPRY